MTLTINDYINAIRQPNRKPICKIEILDSSSRILEDISSYLISGDISLNNEFGIHRNGNLNMRNNTGKFTPGFRDTLWLSTRIKISTGLEINSEEYLVNRGIFVIGEVQVESEFSNKNVNITLLDLWSLLNGEISGALSSPYIIPVGSVISDVITALLSVAGYTGFFIIAPEVSEQTIPYTITKEADSTYADILQDLANLYSYTCFFDRNGIFRFEKMPEDTTLSSVFDYSTDEINYLGSNHRYKFDSVKNSVFVYGDNINGSLVKGTAQDTYLFSPTSVARIGERVLTITDELIYTNDLANERADYELKKIVVVQESADLDSIPIDIIQEGDMITIEDSSNGLNRDRYLVNQINFPLLYDGNMTLSCWKERKIS